MSSVRSVGSPSGQPWPPNENYCPTVQGLRQRVEQAFGADPDSSAAKKLLVPQVMNSMQQYLIAHPGATPEDFLAALDRGEVSGSDMGLYGRHSDQQLAQCEQQLAQLIHDDPAFAAACGLSAPQQTR